MARNDKVRLEWDLREIFKSLDIGSSEVNRTGARVMNRAMDKMRTVVVRQGANKAVISPQKLIRRRVRMRKARAGSLYANIRVLTHDVPAALLAGARDTGRGGWKSRTGRGVIVHGRVYSRGFIRKGIGGKAMVFERRGKDRLPVRVHKIPIKAIIDPLLEQNIGKAADYVADELPRQLTRRMNTRTRS